MVDRINIAKQLRKKIDADIFTLRQLLDTKLDLIDHKIPVRNVPGFPIWDASEPTVRATFNDLVKPRDVAFDIGAHIGALSSSLSRIVGPRGSVVSFEASTETAAQLSINLALNHRSNVTVVHGAVHSQANRLVALTNNGAASRIADANARDVSECVETVVLDDFCRQHDLVPAFMKLDVEGSEFDALCGAQMILETYCPHIVFEHNAWDDRVMDLLQAQGYRLYDAARYVQVTSSHDCEPKATSSNIIAVHESRLANTPYAQPPKVKQIAEYDHAEVSPEGETARLALELSAGRHIIEITGTCKPETNVLYSRAIWNGQVLGQNWTDADFFIHNHRFLPFEARHPGNYYFEMGEVGSRTHALGGFAVKVHKVEFINAVNA